MVSIVVTNIVRLRAVGITDLSVLPQVDRKRLDKMKWLPEVTELGKQQRSVNRILKMSLASNTLRKHSPFLDVSVKENADGVYITNGLSLMKWTGMCNEVCGPLGMPCLRVAWMTKWSWGQHVELVIAQSCLGAGNVPSVKWGCCCSDSGP